MKISQQYFEYSIKMGGSFIHSYVDVAGYLSLFVEIETTMSFTSVGSFTSSNMDSRLK